MYPPSKYENSIEWEIPEMEDSYIIIQPSSGSSKPKGPRAEVMYIGGAVILLNRDNRKT